MEKESTLNILKPSKKFFQIRFLIVSIIFVVLLFFQVIVSFLSLITLIFGIILLPLSVGLFYVFYYILYKKPLESRLSLEDNIIKCCGSVNYWQGISFNVKLENVMDITLYQTFMDKLLRNNSFSLKLKFRKGHEFLFTHAMFNKNSLLFLKKIYKKCDLDRCNVIIDPKTRPYFVKIFSKILK